MSEPNTRRKPERDLDILAEIVAIERLGQSGMAGISQLIDYLPDERDQLAVASMKILHGCLPMAALPERWRDDTTYERNRVEAKIPDWLADACDGWGRREDFVHLCLQKLKTLKHEHEKTRFFDKLSRFMGARRRILARIVDAGLRTEARNFARAIFQLQKVQFPKQVTLAITMNCQLHCDYCISGNTSLFGFREMSPKKIQRLFDWMQQQSITRIALTGGEPTLYSGFDTFLEQIRKRGLELVIATNGLFSKKRTASLRQTKPLCLTMHLTPEVLESKLIRTYMRNARDLMAAGIYVIMRSNFLNTTDDPQAFLDAAQEVGISEIRTAIPMPKASGGNRFVNSRRLIRYAHLLDQLVTGGRLAGITIKLAKPFPVCFMARQTAWHFLSNGSLAVTCPVHFSRYTNNIIIHSDLRYSACLGLDQVSERSVLSFRRLAHAAGSYRNRVKKLMQKPILLACGKCPLWIGGRCIGGCLSYREFNQDREGLSSHRGGQ